MLIDKHTNTNSRHIKTVKKVLNAILSMQINFMWIFQLHYTLCHCLNNISMPVSNFHQYFTKPKITNKIKYIKIYTKIQNCYWPYTNKKCLKLKTLNVLSIISNYYCFVCRGTRINKYYFKTTSLFTLHRI